MSQQHSQRTKWCTRVGNRLRSRFQNLLDRIQRRRNGGYKTFHTFIRNLDNVLVGLPVELILSIATFLTMSERTLLSLTSKRLRVVLTNHFHLTCHDLDQKLEFLLLLEKDLPEYLTCRTCALLFEWKLQEPTGYRCPHVFDLARHMRSHDYVDVRCLSYHVSISRELFDLISKAYCRGPSHGLPASCVDHNCYRKASRGASWIYERFEGRIVNDQFLVARSHTFIQQFAQFQTVWHPGFGLSVCKHRYWTISWKMAIEEWSGNCRQPLESGTNRCRYCATDFRSVLFPPEEDGLIRAQVYVWQNFGECKPGQQNPPSMFKTEMGDAQDERVVALRDLELEFTSSKQSDDTNDHEYMGQPALLLDA